MCRQRETALQYESLLSGAIGEANGGARKVPAVLRFLLMRVIDRLLRRREFHDFDLAVADRAGILLKTALKANPALGSI